MRRALTVALISAGLALGPAGVVVAGGPAHPGPHGQAASAEKVELCHKDQRTLSLSARALSAHLAHGDTQGACTGLTL